MRPAPGPRRRQQRTSQARRRSPVQSDPQPAPARSPRMSTPSILNETLELPALDGYPLTATLYHAPVPVAQLLIAGATGGPQGVYRRFAEYAAQRGDSTPAPGHPAGGPPR